MKKSKKREITKATITLQYDARNKASRAIIEMIERSGLFDILKDEEPNDLKSNF